MPLVVAMAFLAIKYHHFSHFWIDFISFIPLETGMYTLQSNVIYLLNGLMIVYSAGDI